MNESGLVDPMQDPASREVRHLVYRSFANAGLPPSIAELSQLTGRDEDEVRRRLRSLADAHALVLNEQQDSIRMAHPFTSAPMAFVVTPIDGLDDRRWWGGCGWDSFGISAALDLDVRIDSACPQCGRTIAVEAGPQRPPIGSFVVRFPRPATEWWHDVVATCTNIRMFCNRAHAQLWTAGHAPNSGYIADARTVWDLALAWYGDRVAPDFQPHTRACNQTLLTERGLVGAFWRLP